jgi:HAD superfamily phosphatase (TIGR01681 family)
VQTVIARTDLVRQVRFDEWLRYQEDPGLVFRMAGITKFCYNQYAHGSNRPIACATLTRKPTPKKGLITDLDHTLWRGILGEVGIEGISWDMDHRSQIHAFYQRMLGALAAEGVLLGVASKNERSLVESVFGRKDFALSPTVFSPLDVCWGPKSEAVARILKTWNVGPDSVVFVDDSTLELAEVRALHPEVERIQFPTKDSVAILRSRAAFARSIWKERSFRRRLNSCRKHTTHMPVWLSTKRQGNANKFP